MFNRAELKSSAKATLKGAYLLAFVVVLVVSFFSGSTSVSVNTGINLNPMQYTDYFESGNYDSVFSAVINGFIASAMVVSTIAVVLFFLLISVFLNGPFQVGQSYFFLEADAGRGRFGDITYGFKNQKYWRNVGSIFLRDLLISLGMMLLVIPGIILSYGFRLVPYVLANEPGISATEALRKSWQLTRGSKFNIFVLDLSFIGWYLLGAITCGIGSLFVNPYYECVNSKLYLKLNQDVVIS